MPALFLVSAAVWFDNIMRPGYADEKCLNLSVYLNPPGTAISAERVKNLRDSPGLGAGVLLHRATFATAEGRSFCQFEFPEMHRPVSRSQWCLGAVGSVKSLESNEERKGKVRASKAGWRVWLHNVHLGQSGVRWIQPTRPLKEVLCRGSRGTNTRSRQHLPSR